MLNFRKTKLNRWLKDKNIEPIIGATPMLFGEGRPAEVLYWLDTYRSNETNEGGKILGWCFLDECDALDADASAADARHADARNADVRDAQNADARHAGSFPVCRARRRQATACSDATRGRRGSGAAP